MGKQVMMVAFLTLALASLLAAQTSPASPPATETPAGATGADQNTGAGAAQQSNGEATPAQEQTAAPTEQEVEDRAYVPLSLNMAGGGLEYTGEAAAKSLLTAGVNANVGYDTNILSTAAPTTGGFTWAAMPKLGVQVARPRLKWKLNWVGGYLFNQKYSAYNSSSNKADFDFGYRLSPHVTLSLSDSYSRAPQLVNDFLGNPAGPGSGAIQQPNQTVIQDSLVVNQENTGTAQLSYQYSASDMVGASATSNISLFGRPPAGSPNVYFNTHGIEGEAFYNHRFTPRNWGGITYSFDHLTFSPGAEVANTHSLLLLYTFYLRRTVQLAVFAGPEYSSLDTTIVQMVVQPPMVSLTAMPSSQRGWAATGGGTLAWQGERGSFEVSASRKVNSGGGLLGTVELITASGGARRKVARFSDVEINASYGDSRPLDKAASDFTKVDSVSAGISWVQHLTRGLELTFAFDREYQTQDRQSAPAIVISHSRGWASLGYQFGKALGR